MHLVQFLLKIFHLMANGILTVRFPVILRALGFAFCGKLHHLETLIHQLFHHRKTVFPAVFFQKLIFAFRALGNPEGHGTCHITQSVASGFKVHGYRRLEAAVLHKSQYLIPELIISFLFLGRV